MKTIKPFLLIGFCMLSAGTATDNVALQVAGLVACIVLLCAYFLAYRSERARQLNAQAAARQSVTSDMLILEYNDLINAHLAVFVGNGKSKEQNAATAMNMATVTLTKKYGYTADELGKMLANGR
jgi:Na+/melibiose symporter-like transporter